MIQGMIFDLDGTLLDSMFLWEAVGETYLRSVGKEPREDLQKVLRPMSLLQSAAYLKEYYEIPLSTEEIIGGINRTVEDFYLHTVKPKPGASEWLAELQSRQMKMCIATATDRSYAEAALLRWGMRQYFSEIFTCTEVGSGKDKPFIFRRALEHLGTTRQNTAVVEDAFHALSTAKADGFLTVAVYDPYEPEQERLCSMADVSLKDLGDRKSFWEFALAE